MSTLKKNNNLFAIKTKLEDSNEIKMNELLLKQRKWHDFRQNKEVVIDAFIHQKPKQIIVK